MVKVKDFTKKLSLLPSLQILFGSIILLFGIFMLITTFILPQYSLYDNNQIDEFVESKVDLVELKKTQKNITSLEKDIISQKYLSDMQEFFTTINLLFIILFSIQILIIGVGLILLFQGINNLKHRQ